MMSRRTFSIASLTSAISLAIPSAAQGVADEILIDDMSNASRTRYGGVWQLSTDRVMGGVSVGQARMVSVDGVNGANGSNAVHITGQVSTANNGGFVQINTRLRPAINASRYQGIELRVRGDGHPYWVHLRDRNTPWPWQVYRASYETNGRWQTVRVPFSQFEPYHRTRKSLDPASLNSIGLVAGFDDFVADIKIARVAIYS